MLQPDQWKGLLKLFRVPGQPIYILGCFARHVTVYSQQVRALNLISALRREGLFANNPKIAVIGGGAAGLMAAAAACHCGAHVTLLDKLDRPMQMQSNNRQRWLHPFIYDWPFTETLGSEARLPLLTWKAGLASDVAEEIRQQWNALNSKGTQDGCKGSIHEQWRAKNILFDIAKEDDIPILTWTDKNSRSWRKKFTFVIMAVGFGLESQSYWSEDSIDDDFTPNRQEQWLVSGTGDGGLTDVMRLCISSFRHHTVEGLFREVDGIEQLKKQLQQLHPEDKDPDDDETVDEKFREILGLNADADRYRWDALTEVFRRPGMLRTIPPVKITSFSHLLYGPNSSILNRLIISQLERLGRIEFIAAKTKDIVPNPKNGRFEVHLEGGDMFEVDQTIIRHGPRSALEQYFPNLWAASESLRTRWKQQKLNRDNTRLPHWDTDEFGPEKTGAEAINIRRPSDAESSAESISAVKEATSKPNKPAAEITASVQLQYLADGGPNVRAEKLSIGKEVRSDGSSQTRYEIKGLSVIAGTVRGLQCVILTTAGYVGTPVLDEDALRLQIQWEQDAEEDGNPRRMNLPTAEEWAHSVSRTLYFNPPLTPEQGPISFGFSVSLINGDALSNWEFEQMYREEKRQHINGDPISGSEFMARYVWFPLEELAMRITLPTKVVSTPAVKVFACGRDLKPSDMMRDGILQMRPGVESRLHPKKTFWPPSSDARHNDSKYLTNLSSQTWELSVPQPSIGSCYSLNWALPDKKPGPWIEARIREAAKFRSRYLRHGEARRAGKYGDKIIHKAFIELANSLRKRYGLPGNKDEMFEVSFMTYDETSQYLFTIESLISDKDHMQKALGSLKLPFGLGLAGTAFKECDKVHKYQRKLNLEDYRASHYLPLYGSEDHEVLLAIPFEHPAIWDMSPDSGLWETFDRPRTCLGVLNLGSTHMESRLKDLLSLADLIDLRKKARAFVEEWHGYL